MSSMRYSRSKDVGSVPYCSSNQLGRPSSSVSSTLSQECLPSELAKSSQLGLADRSSLASS